MEEGLVILQSCGLLDDIDKAMAEADRTTVAKAKATSKSKPAEAPHGAEFEHAVKTCWTRHRARIRAELLAESASAKITEDSFDLS